MKFSELKKILKDNGCYFCKDGSRHEKWYSPKANKYFSVGRHNTEDVKKELSTIYYQMQALNYRKGVYHG